MNIHTKPKNINVLQRNTTLKHIHNSLSIITGLVYLVSFVLPTILLSILYISGTESTSALSYSDGTNIQFTFNSALSVSVSGNLIINELAPGSSSDSNIITVDVSTNNISGYNLYATVGNSTNYDNTDLSHIYTNPSTGEPVSKFTSLTTNDSIADIASLEPDTWGYSYATTYNDNTTTWTNWTNYSGLPKYDNESTIINSATTSTNTSTGFKIAARADINQLAGDYNNVINFVAITNKAPVSFYDAYKANNKTMHNGYYTMQDMSSSICEAVDTYDEDSQIQLIDIRDENIYWIAKLRDEHCWMTQNLDLFLEQTPTNILPLTSDNTDLNQFGLNNYTTDNGYVCSNPSSALCDNSGEIITWTPERNTINAQTTLETAIDRITNFYYSSDSPNSVDPGNWYWRGGTNDLKDCPSSNATNPAYIACDYISKRISDDDDRTITNNWPIYFSTTPFPSNGFHGHVGNYYNWPSAIASNNASPFTTNTSSDIGKNPQNSICPANWRLPVIMKDVPGASDTNEYQRIYLLYDDASLADNEAYMTAPLYFTRVGVVAWTKTLYLAGYRSAYWFSANYNDQQAYASYIDKWVYSSLNAGRSDGNSIRCIAR